MQIIEEGNGGHVYVCRSDDGLVIAKVCPTTTLYGSFDLYEVASDRPIYGGYYLDYSRPIGSGTMTDEKIPENVWASAIALMRDWTDHARALEAASEQRALERDLQRYSSIGEQIAQDMDQANSDL